MSIFKNEREFVRRVFVPFLKKEGYLVKSFVRLEAMKEKLRKEGTLELDEEEFNHPWRPGDIDALFWKKDSYGNYSINAAEVKYFRLSRGKPYPEAHDGIGQAIMLLTFGVDYVYLIHVFDPQFPSDLTSMYEDIIKKISYSTHLNYRAVKPEMFLDLEDIEDTLRYTIQAFGQILFFMYLRPNPLKNDKEAKIARNIIRKAYRMI